MGERLTQFETIDPDKIVTTWSVVKWVYDNLSITKETSIHCQVSHSGTIDKLAIDTKLSEDDITKLCDKFPELKGKEI
tara:strand:+ start:718 stop:951 length:234 start_codon:yes stop_codon:yes gene_type:complete